MFLRCAYRAVTTDAQLWATLLFGRSGPRALRLSRLRGRRLAQSMSGELLCRELLSEAEPEESFILEEDERNKPYLPGSRLYVSISHSGGYVAAAVADAPVGIDLQELRKISDAVLRRYYSHDERSWINAGEPTERAVRLWTMKEAYGKLLGIGIFSGIRFSAGFADGRIITEYDDVSFHFPDAPEGQCLTVCLAK